ncbi:MAG: hypothetical protein RSC76_05560 [Oscillospiraceae bacterium]
MPLGNMKWIEATEPKGSFTLLLKKGEYRIKETDEIVRFNPVNSWLMVKSKDGFWVNRYMPIFNQDGIFLRYEST